MAFGVRPVSVFFVCLSGWFICGQAVRGEPASGNPELREQTPTFQKAPNSVRYVPDLSRRLALGGSPNPYAALRTGAERPSEPRRGSLTLGLVTGFGATTTNSLPEQALRDRGGYHRNIHLGVVGDLSVTRYWGAEVDGHVNLVSQQRVPSPVSAGDEEDRSIQPYGLMGNLYGKWDFTQGGVRFTPRAGLGYGMLFLARQRHSRQEGDQSESYRILAPYGLVGAELGVARFTFQADLAASFLGSGWHAPRTAGETVLGVAGYQRLRLGLSYRLLAPVSLGTQFVRRILRLGADPQGFTTTEQTDQLLGVVQFHF